MSNTPEHPGAAPDDRNPAQPSAAGGAGLDGVSRPAEPNATQPTTPLPRPDARPAAEARPAAPSSPSAYGSAPAQPGASQPMYSAHGQPTGAHAPGGQPSGQAASPYAPPQAQGYAHPQQPHAYPPAGGSQPPGGAPGHGSTSTVGSAHPKSRSGALLGGLAIGALLGGVVGGGVAAVVASNVQGQTVVQGSASGGTLTLNNPDSVSEVSAVAAVATPSVVTIDVSSQSSGGSGSGVIIDDEGYILTNAHVATLDGAATEGATFRVKLSDGRVFDGELIGTDPYADLAVVKIDADDLTPIDFADSSELNVGDATVAIGAPLSLSNTVTSGVVSALNRGISVGSPLIPQNPGQEEDPAPDDDSEFGFPWDFRFDNPDRGEQQPQTQGGGQVTLPVIQTDASINPGNSGGALLDSEGKLIGINVAIASNSVDSATAGSVGLGFAIPSNLAQRVAESIIAGEQPSHGLLGASVADSSNDTDEDADVSGGLVVDTVSGGAAEAAGLRAGDVITAIDGLPASDGTSVSALVRMHEGGSEIEVTYSRGGQLQQTTATLGSLEW